jgi:hypothetical protein
MKTGLYDLAVVAVFGFPIVLAVIVGLIKLAEFF